MIRYFISINKCSRFHKNSFMEEKSEQMHAFFYKQKMLLIEDGGEGD